MDATRDDFFAGPRFAAQQYGGVVACNQVDQRQNAPARFADTDQALGLADALKLAAAGAAVMVLVILSIWFFGFR